VRKFLHGYDLEGSGARIIGDVAPRPTALSGLRRLSTDLRLIATDPPCGDRKMVLMRSWKALATIWLKGRFLFFRRRSFRTLVRLANTEFVLKLVLGKIHGCEFTSRIVHKFVDAHI
jgi:hypothetical protein